MLKLAVNAMIAAMLLAFPIAFCISQTTGAGIGEEITVSQRLIAGDNNIINSDIYQVSTVKNGDTTPGGSSGGNSDEPGENSGGSSGDSSDDGSGSGSGGENDAGSGGSSDGSQNGGSNSGSGGTPQGNSVGSSSEDFREAEAIMSDQLGNPVNPVVINEIHPRPEEIDKYGNERVELFNIGKTPVNVSLWYMKNMTGQVIGTIHDKEIPPSGFLVANVTGLTGDYQTVTLFDSGNNKMDSVIYIGARSHSGSCYARIPDGASTWEWTICTLGSSNRRR